MEKVSSSIILEAVMDGTTLTASLRTAGTYPFIQRFNSATGAITPDFSSNEIPDEEKPLLYPLVVRSENGSVPQMTRVSYTYIGTEVATAEGNSMTVNPAFADKFRMESYTFTYNGQQVTVPALRIIGNLANATNNRDNDAFGCSGLVEVDGQAVVFSGLYKEFVIEEANGNTYALWLTASNEGQFTEGVQNVTITAHLDIDGNFLEDAFTGDYKIRWYKVTAEGRTQITSNIGADTSTVTLAADDVDNMITIRAELLNSKNDVLATSFIELIDISDPLEIAWTVSDKSNNGAVSGYQLKSGGIANVRVRVVKRSDGSNVSGWSFVLVCYGNDGDILDSPLPVVANNVDVSYGQVVEAGRRMKIYCTAAKQNSVVDVLHQEFLDQLQRV